MPNLMSRLKNEHDSKYEQKLFKNTGGKFVDVSKEAGMIQNVLNFGLGVAVADFNNDNWPDMYVCNDYSEQDYLYINQKDGTFSEELHKYFDHISFSSMGNDAADFNNDGFIDLITWICTRRIIMNKNLLPDRIIMKNSVS